MRTIITPADLPQYVPGEIWLDAVDGRWSDLSIRGYKYKPSDISAPPLADYLLVLYTGGPTRMSRHVDGPRITSDIVFQARGRRFHSTWMETSHIDQAKHAIPA